MSKLTNAQIFTLRRLHNGQKFQMTSDSKYGREVRIAINSKFQRDDVSCKSLAPLMRSGLIQFRAASVCDNGSYYDVELTEAGRVQVMASYGVEWQS